MSDDLPPSEEALQRQIAVLQAQLAAQQAARKPKRAARKRSGKVENTGELGGSAITGSVKTRGGKFVGGDDHSTTINNPPPKDPAEAARLRYLHGLRHQCNYLPLAAMGGLEDASREVTLSDVYIDLMCNDPAPYQEGAMELIRKRRAHTTEEHETIAALELVSRSTQVTLLGGPGSGKSTFINQLAAELAAERLGQDSALRAKKVKPDLLRRFPLRITLRDLAPKLTRLKLSGTSEVRQRELLVDALREQWREELRRHDALAFDEALSDVLQAGDCLMIFDGLDEVPRTTRTLVRKAVLAAVARYPQSRMVITCRVLSYTDGVALPGFVSAELAQLDEDQIKRFIQLWYAAQAGLGRLKSEKAEEKASDLQRAALEQHRDLAQESPLLLTIMAMVHKANTTLPRQRVRLYEKAVEVLLLHWHRGKDLELDPKVAELLNADDGQKLNAVLQSIAYEMQAQQSRQRDAEPLLERGRLLVLLEDHIGDTACASAFLDFVDETSGLLIGQGGDPDNNKKPQMYGFPHRTFQEYLAGRRMAWGDAAERAEMLLARAAEGDYWSLASQYCAESLFYLTPTGDTSLLELLRELCPNDPPETEAHWRALLWAARMAGLAGREAVESYAQRKKDRGLLTGRLIPRLCALLAESRLPAIERAEAGNLMAQLGDPRFDVGFFHLPAPPIPNLGFIEIPAGPFWMGTRKADIPDLVKRYGGDANWYEREVERHEVQVPTFWMAHWPVTVAQFRAFVDHSGYQPTDPDRLRGVDNHPVVYVTWHDAAVYCEWLTEQLKAYAPPKGSNDLEVCKLVRSGAWRVRLPSESEWEKALRGDVAGRAFPWGDDMNTNRANVGRTGLRTTSSVGCFPNPGCSYGCEDLSGNVLEWTRSWYRSYPYRADDGRENLKPSKGDDYRVLRGGSWFDGIHYARAAYRLRNRPAGRYAYGGFRVMVGFAPPSSAL